MLMTRFITLFFVFSIGSLASTPKSISKLTAGFRKIMRLFSCKSGEKLDSTLESMSDESSEEPKNCPEELTKSISSINWMTRLFQQKDLPYSELWPDYNRALAKSRACRDGKNRKVHIAEIVNELLGHIMKSNSLADKMGALKSMDPLLNDKTARHLVENSSDSLQDLSRATESLTVDEIKVIYKNADNAKSLLSVKYGLKKVLDVDLSIWFLLNELKFCSISLQEFKKRKDRVISEIIKHRIILRADVYLELLFINMRMDYEKYVHSVLAHNDLASRWHRYLVNKSPFENLQLYNTYGSWELIVKSVSLEDPKRIASTFDTNFVDNYEGRLNYLLLSQENLTKKLIKLKPNNLHEMYSCFSLGLNIKMFNSRYGIFHKLSRDKHVELVSYFAELQEKSILGYEYIKTQQLLPYLKLLSFIGNNGIQIDMDYARSFTLNPKTFELLDVIKTNPIRAQWARWDLQPFNEYLSVNPNWNEAVGEHFHYFISHAILKGHLYRTLTTNIAEYFGTTIELDDRETLSIINSRKSGYVDCTLDKIPRHLNSLFEIIDKQLQQEISATRRLKIAILGSIFSDEAAGVAYKKDFVHFILTGTITGRFTKSPAFVDLVRISYKGKRRNIKEIDEFLHFGYLVHNCFPSLARIDLETAFQKISAKDSFSVALKNLIAKNFYSYNFPRALKGLQRLKREMLKYNAKIAIRLQLEKISIRTLFEAIYKALGDHCTDLRLALIKHLFNAQLLHASFS